MARWSSGYKLIRVVTSGGASQSGQSTARIGGTEFPSSQRRWVPTHERGISRARAGGGRNITERKEALGGWPSVRQRGAHRTALDRIVEGYASIIAVRLASILPETNAPPTLGPPRTQPDRPNAESCWAGKMTEICWQNRGQPGVGCWGVHGGGGVALTSEIRVGLFPNGQHRLVDRCARQVRCHEGTSIRTPSRHIPVAA